MHPVPLRPPDSDRARARDRGKCAHESEQGAADALSPSLVEAVEPAYSFVPSGNDRAIRLRGALLHFRPAPNETAETMQRSLECHEARVVLGVDPPIASDPYVLAGAWLAIDVDSTGDGLVAAVRTTAIDDARRVLDRARDFGSLAAR
jgi:hypothetical protein